MSTKYELAAELRALCRGTKPLPICRMRKHELEAEIDRLKLLKGIPLPEYPPAKPGPVGPRPIKVESTEDGIHVPTAPPKRVVSAGKPKIKAGDVISLETDLFPASTSKQPAETSVKAPSVKSLPVRSVSFPVAPKRSHSCNCPACPEKAIAPA